MSQTQTTIKMTKSPYNLLYTVISLDTDEDLQTQSQSMSNVQKLDSQQSDPKIYLRKSNLTAIFPASENEQYCGNFGSKVCIVKKYLLNSELDMMITCIKECRFTLKVTNVLQVTPLTDLNGNKKAFNWVEPRSFNIFSIDVPNKNVDSITLELASETSTKGYIDIYYSYQGEDFYNTMETQKQHGLATELGKALKITIGKDSTSRIQDFCWQGCALFIAIRARFPMRSFISVKLNFQDQLQMKNQMTVTKILSPSDSNGLCWLFLMERSLYDLTFNIRAFEGDAVEWSVFQKDNDATQSTSMLLVRTEQETYHQIVITSNDRYRKGEPPKNNLIYLCPSKVIKPTSVQITPLARESQQRFILEENVLQTFMLESAQTKDYNYAYFVYSNKYLPLQPQNLTITVTVQSKIARQSIPRFLYKVCAYSNLNECYLSEQQAKSSNSLILVPGSFNDETKTRMVNLYHQPSVCPYQSGCVYFFSVYNPDNFGEVRATLKLTVTNNDDVTDIRLFQSYHGQVGMGSYQFFKVTFSAQQLSALSISKILIKLTSFNGRADLYASTKTSFPKFGNSEIQASSLSPLIQIEYDVSQMDLMTNSIYIGVYGQSLTSYELKIDAIFTSTYFTDFSNQYDKVLNPLNNNVTGWRDYVKPDQITQSQQIKRFELNAGNTKVSYFFQPSLDSYKTLILVPTIDSQFGPVTLNWSLSHFANGNILANQSTTIKFDNSSAQVIDKRSIVFNSPSVFKIDFSLSIGPQKNTDAPSDTAPYMKMSFQIIAMTVEQGSTRDLWNIESDLNIGQYYENYAYMETVNYRKLILDSNQTFEFKMTNLIGTPIMLIKLGTLQQGKIINIGNDASYDFAKISTDLNSTVSIKLDALQRKGVTKDCVNGSYALRGGNEKCAIYVGIQCTELCIFNLSVSVIPPNNKTVNTPEPTLLRTNSRYRDIVNRGKGKYFYFPFMKNSTNIDDTVMVLEKSNNDSILVARVITNAYLAYQNWSYPNITFNDFISNSSSVLTNEVLEIPVSYLRNRCPNNSSCSLIVGVIGNGPNITSFNVSSFTLTLLDPGNRLQNNKILTNTFYQANSYDFYWFLVNTRVKNNRTQWSHLLSVTTADLLVQQVDIYASIYNSSMMPMRGQTDFGGEQFGPDMINITSDNPRLLNYTKGEKAIFVVSVYAQNADTRYSLLNWGPTNYATICYNMTDLQLDTVSKVQFDQRVTIQFQNTSLNTSQTLQQQFKLFRFFSYGTRDLSFKISANNGSVYILANTQPFRQQISQPYSFEEVQKNGLLKSNYMGFMPGQEDNRQPQQNPFFNVPIFNETSLFRPILVKANTTFTLDLDMYSTYNGVWCQFCWYYIAVFQAALPQNATQASLRNTTVNITASSVLDAGQYVEEMKPGMRYRKAASVDQIVQMKLMLESFNKFTLNITEASNSQISVFLTAYTDYINTPIIWNSTGVGPQILDFEFPSSQQKLQLGLYYYVTVNTDKADANINLAYWQERSVQGLRNQTIVTERIWNQNDIVKYYDIIPPKSGLNYTATLTIESKTPGFSPIIYAYSNDIIDGNVDSRNLLYPNGQRYSVKSEKPFFQSSNKTTVLKLNIASWAVGNYSTSWASNGESPPMYQNYYTVAVYWTNFGLNNISTETEYTVSLTITTQAKSLQVSSLQQSISKRISETKQSTS